MSSNANVAIVALGGGSGTRFWPVSRRSRPKQLLELAGPDPLIAQTFARVRSLARSLNWWMVVGKEHATACHDAVPEVPTSHVLVEPQARNTAPAIALAAMHVDAELNDAVMVVLPADHAVRDEPAFAKAIEQAIGVAQQGAIVTLGIDPTYPETGYGYIERGASLPNSEGAFRVTRFVEKPDEVCAQAYLHRGGFSWNAGIFVMRPSVYLAELQRQLPDMADAFATLKLARGTKRYSRVLRDTYVALTSVSIDKGVMEHALDVVVVPVSCGWSDVGSWGALSSVLVPDEHGNVTHGRTVLQDAKNCVVFGEPGAVVAVLGLDDIAVVHTKDATLVLPKRRAQEARDIVACIEKQGWREVL